jgi:hypothetical protein
MRRRDLSRLLLVPAIAAALVASPAASQPASASPEPVYTVITVLRTNAPRTVQDATRLAEQAVGRSLPPPDTGQTGTVDPAPPSAAQLDAVASGSPATGVRVVQTVDHPSPASPVADLTNGDQGTSGCIWFRGKWIMFPYPVIIIIIFD